MKKNLLLAVALAAILLCPCYIQAFEGRLRASLTRGGQTTPLLYIVGTNFLRIEVIATNRPHPVDILDRQSGELTLLFPHNRSFVRLAPAAENSSSVPPGFPAMPAMPPGVGPQTHSPPSPSGNIGPTNLQGMPAMPAMPQMHNQQQMPPGVGPQSSPGGPATPGMAGGMPTMPMMPPMMMGKMELKATTDTTNLLGYPCTRYELKQRGEVMEIWATDQLLPFQPYLRNQPHRFGPQMIEEQWGELLKAKRLFPLLAVLRFESPSVRGQAAPPPSPDRMRFEVKAITREEIRDGTLFQPPPDYREIQPLPF